MSVQVSPEQLQKLSDCLLNVKGDTPLHERFRALFTLKAVGGDDVVEIVSRGFADPSALLKHELAYVLGQIKNLKAVPHLEAVLIDADGFQGEMVRHEAAEALGALSSVDSLELLKKYKNDESRSVRETCEIAVDKIEYDHFTEEGRARQLDPNFPTTDPAPASLPTEDESASSLRSILLDTSIPLFKRYRAMFALRNIVARSSGVKGKEVEAKEGVRALADGFKDGSALFRHEIAYIFGQLSSPYSIPSLLYVMRDSQEDDMVRHEAAEALGGIASEVPEDVEDQTELYDTEEDRKKGVLGILREWSVLESAPPVVRESCQVALDMYEYENSNQFQYADGLNSSDSAPVEQSPAQRLTGMDRGVDLTSIMA